MRILFLSYNFPPETNALARRTFEHARFWVRQGVEVEILTDIPHFPEGHVYEGYRNRFTRESVDGVSVLRVPQFIAANEGFFYRALGFLTYMLSAIWFSHRTHERPDVVVASSPQFLTALAGWVVSRIKRAPFVLEIRDLWPESAIATGVISRSGIVHRLLSALESSLYDAASHIVVVTNAFKAHLERRGVPPGQISVIKNGVDLNKIEQSIDHRLTAETRQRHRLEGRFVVSYIGTTGDAHGADVLLEAAAACDDDTTVFMIVGTGSARRHLEEVYHSLEPDNFRLVDKQPHHRIFSYYEASDVSVVHLRDDPLFETVIPSKIFECMIMGIPILIGVRGEAREIVLEAEAGLSFTPEDPSSLLEGVARLRKDSGLRRSMGQKGRRYVLEHHDREKLAHRYLDVLREVADNRHTLRSATRPRWGIA